MKSRCYQRGCAWALEVAHMDEAVDQLRQHYRAVHPTKAFYEQREMESLEQYNQSADEFCEQWSFEGLDGAPAVQFDWRSIAHEIQRQRRWHDEGRGYLDPEVIAEVEARVAAHPQDAQQPQQRVRRAMPRFDIPLVRDDAQLDDGILEFVADNDPVAAPEDGR